MSLHSDAKLIAKTCQMPSPYSDRQRETMTEQEAEVTKRERRAIYREVLDSSEGEPKWDTCATTQS